MNSFFDHDPALSNVDLTRVIEEVTSPSSDSSISCDHPRFKLYVLYD
jgi:hypothetical protein